VGGPAGAVVATIGAIVGTLLFRKLGLRAGDMVAEAMGRDPISEQAEEELDEDDEAGAQVEGAPAAPGGGDYRALVRALEAGERERARRELEGMCHAACGR